MSNGFNRHKWGLNHWKNQGPTESVKHVDFTDTNGQFKKKKPQKCQFQETRIDMNCLMASGKNGSRCSCARPGACIKSKTAVQNVDHTFNETQQYINGLV
jgi:hypothetical protein